MFESYRPPQQGTNCPTPFLAEHARQLLPDPNPRQSRTAEFQGFYYLEFDGKILEPCAMTVGGQKSGCNQTNHESIAIWSSTACDRCGPDRHIKVIKKLLADFTACSSGRIGRAL
jgi:hypothetical protein